MQVQQKTNEMWNTFLLDFVAQWINDSMHSWLERNYNARLSDSSHWIPLLKDFFYGMLRDLTVSQEFHKYYNLIKDGLITLGDQSTWFTIRKRNDWPVLQLKRSSFIYK